MQSRRVCSHFLTLLDSLNALNVAVVATTSELDACDEAALRHGRFARRLELRAPTSEHARAILQRRLLQLLHGSDLATDDVELNALLNECMTRSKGLVGVQLERLIDNAALQTLYTSPQFTFAGFSAALRAELPIIADVCVREAAPESIGGLDDVWRQLFVAVVEPLRDWPSYARLGVVKTDGVLLYGPSGCGKSVLVEALARAAALPLITVRGPELLRAEIGASEQLVRRAFEDARAKAPCLLLLDHIDAIARSRDDDSNATSEGTSGRVLGCLLTEMDGLVQRDDASSFIVVATTNRVDLLDRAILRPGRFDLSLAVPFPERDARKQILALHLQRLRFRNDDERVRSIAAASHAIGAGAPFGCTSASLAAVAREAGMNSLRRHFASGSDAVVEESDLVDAAKTVLNIVIEMN